MWFKSGYLIVKKYDELYKEYSAKYNFKNSLYAIPRIDIKSQSVDIKYRGLDRDALIEYEKSDLLSEIRLAELEKEEKSYDGFLFNFEHVLDVYNYLYDEKEKYEIIWARIITSNDKVPKGFVSVGYEPTYFYGDHFSASCDCMLIPRWHGTDKEGTLFLNYFNKLNEFGLFPSIEAARKFLEYYLSFDWTERGDYYISEIFISE